METHLRKESGGYETEGYHSVGNDPMGEVERNCGCYPSSVLICGSETVGYDPV